MYEIFRDLCQSKGVTPYRISKATGIGQSTFSDWKNKGVTPKADKMAKIAEYFGVSMEYLMTGKESSYTEENADLFSVIIEDERLMDALKKYMALTDEKKSHVLEMINLLSEE